MPLARGPTVTTGLYRIPLADVVTKGVWTNTTPVTAYRGAGRPEAAMSLSLLKFVGQASLVDDAMLPS